MGAADFELFVLEGQNGVNAADSSPELHRLAQNDQRPDLGCESVNIHAVNKTQRRQRTPRSAIPASPHSCEQRVEVETLIWKAIGTRPSDQLEVAAGRCAKLELKMFPV